ncbi:hypothetical protein S918_21955 [Salmonella enterica]|nr:hypothetical protein [Salmonella enterica]
MGSYVMNSQKNSLAASPAIRFNGEKMDPVLQCYHLGNGYRCYHPKLMRFLVPDSLSPFDEGGINSYMYCVGNPVNLVDPTGHLSGSGIASVVLGVAGLLLSLFTFGASVAVAAGFVGAAIAAGSLAAAGISTLSVTTTVLSVTSSALSITSASLGIASSVIIERSYEGDAKLATNLGWGSLGTGIASLLTGVGAAAGAAVLNRATASAAQAISNAHPLRYQLGGMTAGAGRISGHGYPFSVLANYGGSRAVDGAKLARLTAQYTAADESIRLTSCFGGLGGRISAGQLLANATGKTVRAASGYHTAATSSRDLNRVFQPLTGLSRQASDITGVAVSGLVRSSFQGRAVLYRAPLQVAQLGIVGTSMVLNPARN